MTRRVVKMMYLDEDMFPWRSIAYEKGLSLLAYLNDSVVEEVLHLIGQNSVQLDGVSGKSHACSDRGADGLDAIIYVWNGLLGFPR